MVYLKQGGQHLENSPANDYSNPGHPRSDILRLFIHYDPADQAALGANVLAIFVLILVAYTSIAITKLLLSFNKENLEGLEHAAESF